MLVFIFRLFYQFNLRNNMIFNNHLQTKNLLGSFYQSGNIVFSGDNIYSPVHNVVKKINLTLNESQVLAFQNTSQIKHLLVSPNGVVMVSIDMFGRAVVFNLKGNFIIAQFNFKGIVRLAKFSSNGELFAVGQDHGFSVYQSPSTWRTFQPFILLKKYKSRHSGDICALSFSPDCRFLSSAGVDNIVYITNLFPIPDFLAISLEVHRYRILSIEYSHDMKYIYTFDEGSNIYVWKWVSDYLTEGYTNLQAQKKRKLAHVRNGGISQHIQDQKDNQNIENQKFKAFSEFQKGVNNGRYILSKKLNVSKPGNFMKRITYFCKTGFLVTGYNKGKFSIYKLLEEELTEVQTYSLGENKLSTIAVNDSCTWVALGIKSQAQLIVWEWKSQSYIFNQAGFTYQTSSIAYNNTNLIANGSTTGKVRIWDQKSGFCVGSFEEHQSSVTGLRFSNDSTLFSCGLDGCVNAYDIKKYKKFRKFTPDSNCQLLCLTLDQSGQIVFAGSFEPYEVYAWNVQTSNLLQIVKGHTGPVTCIEMMGEQLLSGSWDRTLRVHQILSRKVNVETLDHSSQIMAIAVHPNGSEVAICTMRGQIYIWSPKDNQLIGIINSQMEGGRSYESKISAQNNANTKYLNTLAYSLCGNYLVGGGKSKYLIIYDIKHRMVLRKVSITQNRDLKGVIDKLNSRYVKQGTSTYQFMINQQNQDDDMPEKLNNIPGSKTIENQKVRTQLQVEIKTVIFLDTTTLAVETSFGVLICSTLISNKHQFNPYQLSSNLNPNFIPQLLLKEEYASAISLVVLLNLSISKVLKKIPIKHVRNITSEINQDIAFMILDRLSQKQLDFRQLIWVEAFLQIKNNKIPLNLRKSLSAMTVQLNTMKKSMSIIQLTQVISLI